MSTRVEVVVDVDRPIDDVFAHLADGTPGCAPNETSRYVS